MNELIMNEFEIRSQEHDKIICEALGTDRCVVYFSAYKSDKNGLQINNLNKVAIKGKVIMHQPYDSYWGKGNLYHSEVLENPTWLDVCVLAEAMISTTGDYHHRFLEGVKETTKTMDDITIYEFLMGS